MARFAHDADAFVAKAVIASLGLSFVGLTVAVVVGLLNRPGAR